MKIAIIGASKNRKKFSNKAVRAYREKNHVVFPVNPNEREIEGLTCYPSLNEIPLEVDVVSIYVPPAVGIKIVPDIIKNKIKKVYLNPGSESKEMIKELKDHEIKVMKVCSIRKIGVNPENI